MKIIFEKQKEVKLTFNQVECSQFFVNSCGSLCQKNSHNSYCVIADSQGIPCSFYSHTIIARGVAVQRIIPKVAKIEF